MNEFNYLIVITGIIIGMALAHILAYWSGILKYHTKIKIYWVQILWSIILFLFLLQYWFNAFSWSEYYGGSFCFFLFLNISPVATYLSIFIMLPKIERLEELDLEVLYYKNSKWFFGVSACAIVALSLEDVIVLKESFFNLFILFKMSILPFFLILVFSKNRILHGLFTMIMGSALIVFQMLQ